MQKTKKLPGKYMIVDYSLYRKIAIVLAVVLIASICLLVVAAYIITHPQMNRINEFNFEPGVYRHYHGTLYVATDIITHMDNAEGKMEPLQDPLVVYRDLENVVRHVNGKAQVAHQVYALRLSEFKQKFTPE